uniref:Uncharacterized protein n=1 Tax=Anguilla anguilla TaxID=7936 RepID=A0A0E9TZZ8_ANGAN
MQFAQLYYTYLIQCKLVDLFIFTDIMVYLLCLFVLILCYA